MALSINKFIVPSGAPSGGEQVMASSPLGTLEINGVFSTGWLSGYEVTINGGDNTKFDVAAGTGIVMDYTDPNAPSPVFVSSGPFIAQSIPDIVGEDFSLVFVSITGTLVTTSGTLEIGKDRRDFIALSGMTHVAGTVIESVTPRTLPANDYAKSLGDVLLKYPPANEGNDYSTSGANLTLQKGSGFTYRPHINLRGDQFNPSRFVDAAIAGPAPIIRGRQDGSGGFIFVPGFTTVDPTSFDDGSGTLASMPPNKWQVQFIFWVPEAAITVVSYGQTVFNSLNEAKADIPYELAGIDSTLTVSGNLRFFLFLKEGATSLESGISDSLLRPNRFNFSNR